MSGRGASPGRTPPPRTVVTYIVRRLVAAAALLVLVSMITFSIFYLVPRWAGASPETLATRYVGRAATADTVHLTAERLGFYDPIWQQYGSWAKGVVAGADFDMGAETVHCPAPCLGYSFITRQPVWPELLDRMPVTLSLAAGAAVLWASLGVSIGVLSALRRGSVFDRAAMTVALGGVSLPIFFTGPGLPGLPQLPLARLRGRWLLHPPVRQPRAVGL